MDGKAINMDYVREKLEKTEGKVGFYYKNLMTGEEAGINEDKGFLAASVIKIPVIIETFKQMKENKFSKHDTVVINPEDKLPSCGALNYMHDGLSVTIEDLYVLMIIHSDNTATNLLIKKVGMENINTTMQSLGLTETKINRLLFDSKASKEGKENYVSPKDMGILLEKLHQSSLLDRESDNEIIRILKMQRLNHKIPYLITDKVEIAHKTGEDSGVTNDVGIIFSKTPFVICFTSNEVNVKKFERIIQKSSLRLYEQHK